jgi:hypothetical protein
VPALVVTVAVKLQLSPSVTGFGAAESVVVVASRCTTTVALLEVLAK